VNHHHLAVARQVNVELDAVDPEFPRALESR
jgi:hypothetical protein